VLLDPADRRDIRVVQAGEDMGLALEAGQRSASRANTVGNIFKAT